MKKALSALILDRDGTLNAMVYHSKKGEQDSPFFISELELYPRIGDLLAPFARADIPIFIVTNQPGVAKGNFTRRDLAELHAEFSRRLQAMGIEVRQIYACLHHPVGEPGGDPTLVQICDCRKPKPGLLLQVRDEHGIDLTSAIMIGDSQVDVEAGQSAHVHESIQVRSWISDTVPMNARKIINPAAPRLADVLKDLAKGL